MPIPIWSFTSKFTSKLQWKIFKLNQIMFAMTILHQLSSVSTRKWLEMWILLHKIFVALLVPIWQPHILAIFSISRFGYSSVTEMLCTKIHIYNHFPVDRDDNWCKIVTANICILIYKIFRRSLLVNLLVKLRIGIGTLKPLPTSISWPFSKNTWNLAPENASGAQHFKTFPFWDSLMKTTYLAAQIRSNEKALN